MASVDELGNILREAREAKGLTLREVHEEIRISTRFLEALEGGRYADLPSPTHVRGFLRNYARFLGLDSTPLLQRYEQTKKAPPPPAPPSSRSSSSVMDQPLPVREDQPFFDPVNVTLSPDSGGRDSGGVMRLVIIAAFIVFLGLIGSRFLPQVLGGDDSSGAIEEALGGILPGEEPALEATGDLTVAGEAGGDTSRNPTTNVAVDATPVTIDVPTPTPTRPALPAVLDEINLRLDVVERTWLRVTVDGEVQYQGMAVSNDVFEYRALGQVEVAAGNAIGVLVTINETELGRMGSRGEGITEIWRTNSGG
jgi:transcriptional regulator with XRE-family HTH domain